MIPRTNYKSIWHEVMVGLDPGGTKLWKMIWLRKYAPLATQEVHLSFQGIGRGSVTWVWAQ